MSERTKEQRLVQASPQEWSTHSLLKHTLNSLFCPSVIKLLHISRAMSDIEKISPYKRGILQGKVALVTGGGSGINFGIARWLAYHGADLALMGRRQEVHIIAIQINRRY